MPDECLRCILTLRICSTPEPTLMLSGGGVLPDAGPLTTGNGWNTMGVCPSTTATTRR